MTSPPLWRRVGVQVAALIACSGILVLVVYLRSPMRSGLAQEALRRVRANPQVVTALGEPIRLGWLAEMSVREDQPGWNVANLAVPLSGPKAKGIMRVAAGRSKSDWVFATLDVLLANEPGRVDVLQSKLDLESPVRGELIEAPAPPPDWDGGYSVLRITPEAGTHDRFSYSLTTHRPTLKHDLPVNAYDVLLPYGMFVLRETDLFVDDVVPLCLVRAYRVWDSTIYGFGRGASHSYDVFPSGSRFPYTYMDLNLEDRLQIHFERISRGTGFADAAYEHRATSSEFYEARVWWNGDGWTFRLRDGTVLLFPEAYNAKNAAQGAAFEIRENGRIVRLDRDVNRNLRSLVSPNGKKIVFQYDDASRVVEVASDAGNWVKYRYDSEGRLGAVKRDDGHEAAYTYAGDMMVTISDQTGRTLLTNSYENGRVSRQLLADGRVFRYRYVVNRDNQVTKTVVSTPDGEERTLLFEGGRRLIDRERDSQNGRR